MEPTNENSKPRRRSIAIPEVNASPKTASEATPKSETAPMHRVEKSVPRATKRQGAPRQPGTNYTPTRRAQKPIEPWKKTAAIAAAVVLAIGIIHATGVDFFQTHLFPNTSVGTMGLGMMSYEEANAKLPQSVAEYTVTITGDGVSASLTSTELGITPASATVQSLNLTGNALAWPLELFAAHTAPASALATTNKETLDKSVTELVETHNENASPATDASIAYHAETNSWSVTESTLGTTLDAERVVAKVSDAVSGWQPTVSLGVDELAPSSAVEGGASVATTSQLQKEADQYNKMFDFNFVVKLGKTGTFVVNRRFAPDWTTVDDDYNVTYSEEKFNAWFDRVAASLDTVGGQRHYIRADGKAVSVSGGTYGWEVDRDKLHAAITQGISTKSTSAIDVECKVEGSGYKGPDGPDFGFYADVDITEQHARVYDENDNVIWETDVITGWDNGYYDTPTGVYVINSKESPSVLQSSLTSTVTNPDGTTEDVTVTFRHDVSYWMPFISNFIGFHDATWQTQGWGGDLYHYQSTGSGGCVNLPLDKAAELWEILPVGAVVSVHF